MQKHGLRLLRFASFLDRPFRKNWNWNHSSSYKRQVLHRKSYCLFSTYHNQVNSSEQHHLWDELILNWFWEYTMNLLFSHNHDDTNNLSFCHLRSWAWYNVLDQTYVAYREGVFRCIFEGCRFSMYHRCVFILSSELLLFH